MFAHSATQAVIRPHREDASKVLPSFSVKVKAVPHPRHADPVVLRQTWYVVGKVILDCLLAAIISLVALPILVLLAVLIRLTSRGPVVYSQVRLGRHGRPFSIYKFRTMYHDCECSSGVCWSRPGDPRVTPVGRILRATHLDELPQLWNILRGDMSLVGPRPERPEFVPALERAIVNYRDRLQVRPGLTGLAQVQLPPDTDIAGVRRKVAHDLYYLRHFSCWMDCRILLCTVFHIFGLPCHDLCRALLRTAREPLPEVIPPSRQMYSA
jgi:lipopolysaccharide/colanic/teichoic acid biosynthesis glycosyltransferase